MFCSDRSRILSFALAAFLFAVPAKNFAADEIKLDAVSGLTLSGYDKSDELKWTIAASAAELEEGSNADGVDAIKNGKWNVRGLEVKTFSDGNDDVSVTSATAVFFPKERRAEGKELVEVKDVAKRFYVKGIGWLWKCDKESDVNTIAVTNGVSVELYDSKASNEVRAEKTIKISAQRLDIRLADDETILTFGGSNGMQVKVTQGNVVTTCDKLEVVIPQNAHEMDESAHDSSNEKTSLNRIRKISGSGNVKILHDKREISGESVDLVPEENHFYLNGNAKFLDPGAKLKISGEKAVGVMRETGKKFFLDKITLVGKNDEKIQVTTQSLEDQKAVGKNAIFTGKKLSVTFPQENETTVALEGDVRFNDATITLNCDKLEMDSLRNLNTAGGKNRLAAIREIRASGNVKATQDGRICECESAVIDATRELTILSGNPRVSVPAQDFQIAGDRCEIDRKNEIIRLYKEESGKPIRAELRSKSAKKNILLCGDFLEVSRDSADKQNLVFDLSGNVELEDSAEQLSGTCHRLLTHYRPQKTKTGKTPLNALQKIEALGDVKLQKESTRIFGGKVLLLNNVVIKEWIREDADGSDGENPMQVKVLPGDEDFPGPRPRIVFPQSATSRSLNLPLPGANDKKKPSASREICVEGDELETIIGERRLRFWLRENVVFTTAEMSCSCAEFEAEMRRKNSKAAFEPEAIFCRNGVKIIRDDVCAYGKQLEIFPKKQIGFLSGNTYIQSEKFGRTTPGKSAGDRFILDLAKKEVRMEMDPKLLEGTPAQVARPRTMLPKNIRDEFSLKLKKHKHKHEKE